MAAIGGILGALIGFAVGILFTEVIFANNQSWPDVGALRSRNRGHPRRVCAGEARQRRSFVAGSIPPARLKLPLLDS
jgi:hypothetical protein